MDSEIPPGWSRARLGEMAEIRIGGTPTRARPEYWAKNGQGGHKWLAISDMKTRRLSATAERITDEGVRRSNVKLLPAGTPVMSFKLSVGRTGVLAEPMYTNEAIAGFITHDALDPVFLRHYLDRYDFYESTDQAVKGVTLNKEKLTQLPLVLPVAAEQHAIATVLDAIDEAIEKTEAVIAATEDLRKALLQELLTRGVPGWHTEWKTVPGVGTIPACWEVVRLGEVLLKIEAGRSPNCESRPAREDEWGVLKVSSVSWDDYLPAENKALPAHAVPDVRFEVRAGDLLMSRANTPSLVGRSVLVEKTRPRLLLCDKTLRLVPDERRASASLINAILSMPYVRKQIEDSGSGTSLSMQNVSQGAIRQLLVVFPPSRRERELIENAATACRNTLARTRTAAGGVRNLKAQAADALLSGRVRMPAVGEVSQ